MSKINDLIILTEINTEAIQRRVYAKYKISY